MTIDANNTNNVGTAEDLAARRASFCYPSSERELIRAAIRGDFPIEQLDAAAEHLVTLQIERFQREHPRPKSRVTVCQSCCGWSHHGRFCRGCKKLYGDPPLTAFQMARAKIAFDHKHYRDLARARAEKDPPVFEKLDAIQYIMTPYAGAADRARRHCG